MSKIDDLLQKYGILDSSKLTEDIEHLRKSTDSYLEAIVQYCEQYSIEITSIKSLLSPQIVSKLTREMQDLHLIEQSSTNSILF
jgi:hypothetical protein